jgi:hypothetical protein
MRILNIGTRQIADCDIRRVGDYVPTQTVSSIQNTQISCLFQGRDGHHRPFERELCNKKPDDRIVCVLTNIVILLLLECGTQLSITSGSSGHNFVRNLTRKKQKC